MTSADGMKRKGQIKFSTTPRAIAARSTSGGLSRPGTATSLEGVGLFISAVGCPSDLCAANQFASDRRQQEPRIRHYLAGSNGTGLLSVTSAAAGSSSH